MSFRFCESMTKDYWSQGFMNLRGIVPPPLRRDLRREADKARIIARENLGPQAPRLSGIDQYSDRVDLAPFRDYCELPDLCEAIIRIFGEGFIPARVDSMSILIEPLDHSWVHGWHRDGAIEVPPARQNDPDVRGALAELWRSPHLFNQVNCALYRDSTLWFVPGSHMRDDLPGEVQTSYTDLCPARSDNQSEEQFEQICLDHAQQFKAAVQIHQEPGDFLVYRNAGWHCAHIVKYQPRATLHHNCHSTVSKGFSSFEYDWLAIRKRARAPT